MPPINFHGTIDKPEKADSDQDEQNETGGNLAKRRKDIVKWQQVYYGKKYDTLCHETMELIKTIQGEGKETDEYIEVGGLRLRKKPLHVDINNKNNKNGDVFNYTWANYSGGKDTMIGIKQKVLNDDKNAMHNVVEEEIRQQKGYRPAIKADFDKMLAALPGKNEEEKLLALQMVSGWFGW